MAQTQPGTYVLYKEPGIDQPPWPAIVYVDDYAPYGIQQQRPSGYVVPVLLIGEPYRFRWATTPQLSPLVAIGEGDLSAHSKDLRQACEMAVFMKDAMVGLDYWKEVVGIPPESGTISDSEADNIGDKVSDVDEELQQALRISRSAYYGSTSRSVPSPTRLLCKRSKRQSSVIIVDDDDDYKDNFDLYSHPPLGKRVHSLPKRSRSSLFRDGAQESPTIISDDEDLPRKHTRTKIPSVECVKTGIGRQQKKSQTRILGGTPLDQLLGLSSLGQRPSSPISDAIDGDISASKDFIQVPVGPNREIRTLQKKDLWDRPYFQDTRTGTNHFGLNADNTWELHHPQLVNIDSEDFQFVAEYLIDGDFGLRQPENQEQTKEAIAQCVSAWETGEKLGMDDMLEHIAEKIKFLEWDNEDVLTLAILIYRSSGPSLHAHEVMKDWVSSYLAHHFWIYIKDDTIGEYFRKRMRRLPELERDVFVKRAHSLTTGAEPDEDRENDDDKLENDEEL